DHPDIRDFIWCKAREEEKAEALREAGFDMSIDGEGFLSIQYQNANNSVRVTQEFLDAVERDEEWRTTARVSGEPLETLRARELDARRRPRVREPRRAADGAWTAIRLRRGPLGVGRDHGADDRAGVQDLGRDCRRGWSVRRVREEPRAAPAGDAKAPRRRVRD